MTENTPPGIIESEGAAAASTTRAELRASKRADPAEHGEDPLEGLAARIAAEKRPELALDPLVIAAASELRADDAPAFDVLRRELKALGVSLTAWTRALDTHDQTEKRAAKAREKEAARDTARQQAEARAMRQAEEKAARDAERAAVQETELAAHYSDADCDGNTFSMCPGRVELLSEDKQGETTVRTLAFFSAPVVEDVSEITSPDPSERPTRTVVLSLRTDREGAARRIDLPAEDFDRMLWPATYGATVGAGPGTRDLLRCALERLSSPERFTRLGFLGWFRHGEAWRYATAGEVLGPPVERLSVRVSGFAAGYALPPPVDPPELQVALGELAQVLTLEPRGVLTSLLGVAFRAPLGPSRCVLHLVGAPTVGKTYTSLWFARLFGPLVEALDWTGATAVGLKRALATVGEAPVVLDDLRLLGTRADEDTARRVDEVIRFLSNRTSAPKGQRTGGVRAEPRARCLGVSTGEVIPNGHSARSRVAMLEMDRRAEGLPKGDFSPVMSAFLTRIAPKVEELRELKTLETLDRAAARRAGIDPGGRPAEVFGAVALGLEYFHRFAAEHGVEVDLDAARRVVAQAARASAEETAEENPAPRSLELLASVLRAGGAHIRHQRAAGSFQPPDNASVWGWELDSDGSWRARGPCVGYLHHMHAGELLLDPHTVVGVLRAEALRQGHPLPLDAKSLGAALDRAGYLARTDGRNRAVKVNLGGARPRLYAVRLPAYEDPHAPVGPAVPVEVPAATDTSADTALPVTEEW